MAAISDYFKHDVSLYPKSGLEFYVFDNSKATAFIQDCLIPFREAYISEDKLTHIVSRFPTTRKEAISRRLPRKGMVMSGDFGEILSFYLAIQTWTPAANVLPMKWRFRDSKKDASKYTDIILFSLQDPDNPSTSDSMFTYEVKTCATGLGNSVYKIHKRPSYVNYKDGKLECTILEAVFDAWNLGNDLIKTQGFDVAFDYYKNSTFYLNELTVENHHYFTPFRGNKRLAALEKWLQSQFENGLSGSRIEGTELWRPPVMVTALFLIEHAYSHFLHEGLTWRMVLDWMMFSRKHKDEIDWSVLDAKIDEFGFRKFYESYSRL